MGRRRRGEPPRYLLHRASGQAYLTLNGNMVYLGVYGTRASRDRYKEEVERWQADEEAPDQPPLPGVGSTLAEVVAEALDHARLRFRKPDGVDGSEYLAIRRALAALLEVAGMDLLADRLAIRHLEALKARWVAANLSRVVVNQQLGRVKRMVKRAHRLGAISGVTLGSLLTCPSLESDETTAPEPRERLDVSEENIGKALPHLPSVLVAMVQIQGLVGMRPSEVCGMRAADISQEGVAIIKGRAQTLPGVWVYATTTRKGRGRKARAVHYLIGPRAQAILEPWLHGPPQEPVFGHVRGGQRRAYTNQGYRHAILRACQLAGIEPWTPHQLRHTVVTRYDREAGLEKASQIIGHRKLDTTALYAHARLEDAASVVARLG